MRRMALPVLILLSLAAVFNCSGVRQSPKDYPIRPVEFDKVRINGGFWLDRMETNRNVTIPYCFKKCEDTGRISNFAVAGGLKDGEFEGIYFNDSDLYKVIEGAAYSLKVHPNPELEKYIDGVIDKIAAAQWDDGYLYTFYSIPEKQPQKRWSNIKSKHELYCAGHFFEGAVAYYRATGKRQVLDVAIELAGKIDSVFGSGGLEYPPGHEEIEIGLVKLYRLTGEKKYLDLAEFFIDQRGNAAGHDLYGPYSQDHKPVTEQREAAGHAVRAGYLYAGMADIAAVAGKDECIPALDAIWSDIVKQKMYLTGGIGARHGGESFGDDYELPNLSAYCETCAAIANALFNRRMFLLYGDAKYMDVVERIIYNGFLSGISMEGNRFFYQNPLASKGNKARSPWFGCSCCPVNIVRFVPSIPGYMYASRKDDLYVCLFGESEANVKVGGTAVELVQKTAYPWKGRIAIEVNPDKPEKFALKVRIPGWARGEVAPGDLYRYMQERDIETALKVNGSEVGIDLEKGFAILERQWKPGDVVELTMEMPVRRVLANQKVEADKGRVALERGPLVYCAEGVDNSVSPLEVVLPDDAVVKAERKPDMLGGIVALTADLQDGPFTAIPFYSWAHRGKSAMNIWFARKLNAF